MAFIGSFLKRNSRIPWVVWEWYGSPGSQMLGFFGEIPKFPNACTWNVTSIGVFIIFHWTPSYARNYFLVLKMLHVIVVTIRASILVGGNDPRDGCIILVKLARDLTRSKGSPLISGKSRLVKDFDLARCFANVVCWCPLFWKSPYMHHTVIFIRSINLDLVPIIGSFSKSMSLLYPPQIMSPWRPLAPTCAAASVAMRGRKTGKTLGICYF